MAKIVRIAEATIAIAEMLCELKMNGINIDPKLTLWNPELKFIGYEQKTNTIINIVGKHDEYKKVGTEEFKYWVISHRPNKENSYCVCNTAEEKAKLYKALAKHLHEETNFYGCRDIIRFSSSTQKVSNYTLNKEGNIHELTIEDYIKLFD